MDDMLMIHRISLGWGSFSLASPEPFCFFSQTLTFIIDLAKALERSIVTRRRSKLLHALSMGQKLLLLRGWLILFV